MKFIVLQLENYIAGKSWTTRGVVCRLKDGVFEPIDFADKNAAMEVWDQGDLHEVEDAIRNTREKFQHSNPDIAPPQFAKAPVGE